MRFLLRLFGFLFTLGAMLFVLGAATRGTLGGGTAWLLAALFVVIAGAFWLGRTALEWTIMIGSLKNSRTVADHADLYIRPAVERYGMFEWKSINQIVVNVFCRKHHVFVFEYFLPSVPLILAVFVKSNPAMLESSL